MPESPGLRTLERGLAVLELLGTAEVGFQVSEVAQRLKLPMGTTHRLLQTLMYSDYVEQDPSTRRYQLGLKVLELRGATVGAMRIATEARPYLKELMVRTGLLAHLAVYRGGSVVYIDRVDNAASLDQFVPIGKKAPAHATSLGKALLAYATDEDVEAFLVRHELIAVTPATITDPVALREALAVVRQRGFAVDQGESREDRHCVAAPIFDYTGRAVAAASVAGRPEDVRPRLNELPPVVMDVTRSISERFGFREELAHSNGGRDQPRTWRGEAGA